MSYRRSLTEIAERLGEGTAELPDLIGDQIATVACGLWRSVPDKIANSGATPFAFSRGYMTSICKDRGGNPPLPEFPASCETKLLYFGTFTSKTVNTCDTMRWMHSRTQIPESQVESGALTEDDDGFYAIKLKNGGYVRFREISEQVFNDRRYVGAGSTSILKVDDSATCGSTGAISVGSNGALAGTERIVNTSEFCQDNTNYPPTPPIAPGGNTYFIDNGDDTTILEISPVLDVDGNINFPMSFTVNNDVKVTLDMGGLTFENNYEGEEDDTVGDPPVYELPPGGVECILPPTPRPDSPDLEDDFPDGIEEEDEVEEVVEEQKEVLWVYIIVAVPPSKGKTILQNDELDITYFAGYFSWTIKDGDVYKVEEYPIRHKRMAFRAPDYAEGYRAYAVNGARIKVKAKVRKVDP